MDFAVNNLLGRMPGIKDVHCVGQNRIEKCYPELFGPREVHCVPFRHFKELHSAFYMRVREAASAKGIWNYGAIESGTPGIFGAIFAKVPNRFATICDGFLRDDTWGQAYSLPNS